MITADVMFNVMARIFTMSFLTSSFMYLQIWKTSKRSYGWGLRWGVLPRSAMSIATLCTTFCGRQAQACVRSTLRKTILNTSERWSVHTTGIMNMLVRVCFEGQTLQCRWHGVTRHWLHISSIVPSTSRIILIETVHAIWSAPVIILKYVCVYAKIWNKSVLYCDWWTFDILCFHDCYRQVSLKSRHGWRPEAKLSRGTDVLTFCVVRRILSDTVRVCIHGSQMSVHKIHTMYIWSSKVPWISCYSSMEYSI